MSPAHPGYIEYSALLDYLEKYATCSAMYLHEFGNSYSNREQIHEMWQLRKMVRDCDEWKVEDKWNSWYKSEVRRVFGDSCEHKAFTRPTKDNCTQMAFKWIAFNKQDVEKYYKDNKEEIIKSYLHNIEDLWFFYFESDNRFEDVEKAIKFYAEAYHKTDEEARRMIVEERLQPHDIIEHYAHPLYREHLLRSNEELNAKFEALGKFIFSPVYRLRDETTEIGYDRRDVKDKEYKKELSKYNSLSDEEKADSYPPFKAPALLMWWD